MPVTSNSLIQIDGSQGEGGGQILRTALALSIITSRSIELQNIRANRSKPGLLRQHLTAIRAAAEICDGQLDGATMGSQTLRFTPGAVKPGEYTFAIGSAGSTTLVLQTVLAPLLTAAGSSTIHLEGGTHNPQAPPFDFLEQAFLPLVCRMGPKVTANLDRHGFYPAGGGRCSVWIDPAPRLEPIALLERGEIRHCAATSLVAGLPRTIGDRELAVVADKLNWPAQSLHFRHLPGSHGPGNVLMLQVTGEHVTEVFTSFGERGVPAETVAARAVAEVQRYLAAEVAVGEHLADQLMLLLALAGGGAFTTLPLTSHSTTNREIIERFLDVRITARELRPEAWLIEVAPK